MKAKWRKNWYEAPAEDIGNAANRFRMMFRAERDRGNYGLAQAFDGAAYALDRLEKDKQYARVVYDLKRIARFDMDYTTLWFPGSSIYAPGFWGFFVRAWDTLTWKMNWDPCVYPSFPTLFRGILDNIHRFVSWWVFPWRRWRWRFMNFFVNENGSKALWDRAWCANIRNREADCAYYQLSFTGCHYKLVRIRWVDSKGEGQNRYTNFVYGLMATMAENDEAMDKAKEEARELREEKTVISSGWVFGWKSFVREMDKVVEATPDLGWVKRG